MLPPIDFSKLTWQEFEELVAALLTAEGFKNVVKVGGSGGDMGCDISADELRHSKTGQETLVRWVVQAKHYAGQPGRRAVKIRNVSHDEISGPLDFLDTHRARGLLVVTDTDLTPSAAKKLIDFHESPRHSYEAAFWNGRTLTDRLRRHPSLVAQYFRPRETSASRVDGSNPFKFLEPFHAVDHQRFFGRSKEIQDLAGLIHNVRVCVLFGESGTGKTSLLNAGLLPSLAADGFLTAYVRCLSSPTALIRGEVVRTLRTGGFSDITQDLAAAENVSEFLKEVGAYLARADQRLLIVVDQFEELFTRASEQERNLLAQALTSVHSHGGVGAKVTLLFSLREDYLGSLWNWSADHGLLEVWSNTYRLTRLSQFAAGEAIVSPMAAEVVTPAPQLIQILLSDLAALGDGHIYPPYIQIVAGVLYENAGSAKGISLSLYKELGRAERIIGDYLDERLFTGLSEDKAMLARSVLDSLTGGEGLRTILSFDELAVSVGCFDRSEIQEVLEVLVKRRIVTCRTDEPGLGRYELVHDFLSRRFFERLHPEQRQQRTKRDVFLRAFREWKEHKVLISKSTLDEFFTERFSLPITDQHYPMILESAFATGKYAGWRNYLGPDATMLAIEYVLTASSNETAIAIALRHPREIKRMGRDDLVRSHLKGDWWLASKAVECLGLLGESGAVDEILPFLNHEWVRNAAIHALAQIGDIRATPHLLDLLETLKDYSRSSVAVALGQLGDERAILPLLNALSEPIDSVAIPGFKPSVIRALGDLCAAPAVDVLISELTAFQRGELYLLGPIAEALGKIGDPRAVAPLLAVLPHASHAQREVIRALGALGGYSVRDTMLGLLESEDPRAVVAAAEVLGSIGDKDSVKPLVAAIERVPQSEAWVLRNAINNIRIIRDD